PELQSPFDQLREVDGDGKEWWNSRKLARVMGYGKYWNFERVIAKAQAWTSQKGYPLIEHFREITEMAELGSGAIRQVTSIMLSRAACMAVAMNADKKKDMVKVAQEYFSATITPELMAKSLESTIMLYKGAKGKTQVQVVFDTNTFWLSQQRMAELFGVTQQDISHHLQQIDQSGEIHLSEGYKKYLYASEQWSENVAMYNLDVVIAVGYRVNSYEATQFRIWATQVLKEYLTKGFVLDDDRLKGKNVFGADYFDDLLDRIREIRLSERRYYQKITDIYSECSSDYDKDSEVTRTFFKMVQNTMHYAVTQKTAAELIYERADAERPHMGLTTWKNAPDGRVVKSDVTKGKNYLSEKEIDSLNRLSSAFIDIAEQRAQDHILMTMTDWADLLKRYMDLNNRPLLPDAGRITHEEAMEKAFSEYDKYRIIQDREIMSDFDKQLKLLFGE
ncbi:MAG: virulence RhuM family protein, partial [Bacteroidaceae bacterium]|nr:virulence RhuM family protein [Bacteroidaceae bacterium]